MKPLTYAKTDNDPNKIYVCSFTIAFHPFDKELIRKHLEVTNLTRKYNNFNKDTEHIFLQLLSSTWKKWEQLSKIKVTETDILLYTYI